MCSRAGEINQTLLSNTDDPCDKYPWRNPWVAQRLLDLEDPEEGGGGLYANREETIYLLIVW